MTNLADGLVVGCKEDCPTCTLIELVLFNRYYQPDFDLEKLEVAPTLILSNVHEMRLPLRWTAILYGQVPVDFAITSGVRYHLMEFKGLMAGAKVTMLTSEPLRNGSGRIAEIPAERQQ